MSKRRLFLRSVSALAFALGLAGQGHAQQSVLDRIKQTGTLKVATETAFAPFDFIKDGAHVGLNVDLYNEMAKEMGVKIEWVLLPWEGVLPGLEAGRFDAVAGPVTITKARMERYRFTTPIADATAALLKRTRDNSISKPEDVAGKVVGAAKSSAQLAQLKAFSETLPKPVTPREYPGNNEAYADLATGRIAAVANSLPNITYVAQQRPEVFTVVQPVFGPKTYFGYLTRKDEGSATLMQAMNEALMKIKSDGRLAALQKKWFGVSFEVPETVTDPAF